MPLSRLRRIASRVDDAFDLARMHLRRLRGLDAPVRVQVYAGHGTRRQLYVAGSVFVAEEDDEREARGERSRRPALLRDVRATLSRYREQGVMRARLTIRHGRAEITALTDADGFFHAALDVGLTEAHRVSWPEVEVRLEDFPGRRQPPSTHVGEVMVPPAGADIGIISDFDDTVLRTGVHDLRRNWRQAIRSDPDMREAFPGLAELYLGLTHDREGVQRRPVFYVSSAAWGFYPLFRDFMSLRAIPQGPLFLKNYGLDRDKWFSGGHQAHKSRVAERLFETYPDMRFILVGDSGQHDAMIYSELVGRHPERVLAVWIRDLSGASAEQRDEAERLIRELRGTGARVAFGPDLITGARQAAKEGWMPAEAVAPVEQAVAAARSGAA